MDLPKNHFKAALKSGLRQVGLWCTIPDPGVVELLAGAGYDWLLIDTEHSPMDAVSILPLLQAAAPYPVTPIVRPGWNNPVEIKKMLDCGAQTLLVPFVQNADEARAAVAATRYPPEGIRGVAGLTRATRYGAISDYAASAHEEICVLVQVETEEALRHIDAIAAVPGVDGIFIGPADLAASMGYAGQPTHPKVKTAILDATARIAAAGLPPGILSPNHDLLSAAAAHGAKFIAVGVDTGLLRSAAMEARGRWS